jgi:hypothetical protein
MKQRTILVWCAAVGVLALAAWLRLSSMPEDPAWDPRPRTQSPATRWQAVRELNVPSFTRKVTVYHSAGHEKRTRELSELIEEAVRFYQERLQIEPEFSVAVLTRADWERVEPNVPFGLPSVSAAPAVILLPATHDGVVVEGVLALRGKASAATLQKIEQAGFTFEQGAEKLIDFIALHELGHVLTLAHGIRPPSPWSNEFLATYFAYAWLHQAQPRQAALFLALTCELQYRDADRPRYTTLEDFDALYSRVGPVNYGWYQSVFAGHAAQVHDARQLAFLADVRTVYPATAKEGEPARVVLERLERICPGFVAWSEGLR